MKRDGASPVVAAFDVSVDAAGEAEAEATGDAAADADADAAGVGVEVVDLLLDCCEATIAVRIATPRRTAMSTPLDEPWRGVAVGLAGAAGLFTGATGVVETFTRSNDAPVGTGGITTDDALDLRAGAFFATFLAVVFFLATAFFATAFLATAFLATFLGADFFATFLAVVFLAVDFLAVVFLAVVFLAVVFLAVDFLATDFFATFFAVVFLAVDFFFTATFISSDRMGKV